jgi:DNA-binding HxlR family transcriptional regulator
MPPSKLERYLNILEALVNRPRKINQITGKVHMKDPVLKRHLRFLVSNGVVQKRMLGNGDVLYAITERGIAVFKSLRALRYFERLKDSLPVIDEAREIASMLSEHPRKMKED